MKTLNWFDRLSLVKIVGEVTHREIGMLADGSNVTMYELTDEYGIAHKCGLLGIQKVFEKGDSVKVHILKLEAEYETKYVKTLNFDGSTKIVSKNVRWKLISEYEVFDD